MHPVSLACRLSGRHFILTFAFSAIFASAALLMVTTAFGQSATAADAANKKKRKGASSFGMGSDPYLRIIRQYVRTAQSVAAMQQDALKRF